MNTRNKCMFGGNLTRDAEGSDVGDSRVVKVSIAVNDRVKNRSTGEYEDRPYFVEGSAWNGTAKFIENNFKKGDPIQIEGKARLETWEKEIGGEKVKFSRTTFLILDADFPPSRGNGKDKGDGDRAAPAQGKKNGGGKSSGKAKQDDYADAPADNSDIPF